MSGKHDIKLTLSRAERRELDRAARAAGHKTGPWARLAALAASRGAQPVKPLPGPEKRVLSPMEGPSQPGAAMHSGGAGKLRTPSPLIKTYDPDQP